jgi:hypothetical protein
MKDIIGEAFCAHGKVGSAYKILIRKLKGRDHLGNLGVEEG